MDEDKERPFLTWQRLKWFLGIYLVAMLLIGLIYRGQGFHDLVVPGACVMIGLFMTAAGGMIALMGRSWQWLVMGVSVAVLSLLPTMTQRSRSLSVRDALEKVKQELVYSSEEYPEELNVSGISEKRGIPWKWVYHRSKDGKKFWILYRRSSDWYAISSKRSEWGKANWNPVQGPEDPVFYK